MHFVRQTMVSAVFLGSIGACGGSSTSTSPKLDTGLPPNEPLNQLTDQQAQQACQALADAINTSFGGAKGTAFGCTLFALVSTTTPTTCQSQVKDCEANPPSGLPTTGLAPDCTQASAAGLSNCTATVSDFERCSDDALATLRAYEAQFTCSSAGNLQKIEQLATSQPTQPDSCVKLNNECPGSALGTGTGSSDAGGARPIPGYGSACTSNSDCAMYQLVCSPQQNCVECVVDSDCISGATCSFGACRIAQSNTGGTSAAGGGGSSGIGATTGGGVGGTSGGVGGAP